MRRGLVALLALVALLVVAAPARAEEPLPHVRASIARAVLGGLIVSGGGVGGDGTIVVASLHWPQGTVNPTISQATQANASAPQPITVAPQAPGASCTNATNCTPGGLTVSIGTPGGSGGDGFLQVTESAAVQFAAGHLTGAGPTQGAVWVSASPGANNNFAFRGDGTNSVFNAPTGAVYISQANTLLMHIQPSLMQWETAVGSPVISQAPLTTVSGTGNPLTVQAQNETGGGTSVGGALNLTSGTGAQAAGAVNLQTGGTTVLTVGPQAFVGGPASIGMANQGVTITASSNTTFTLTAAQYQVPMIILIGTLTSAAVATVAFPQVTAIWWVDYSQVVFTSGSVNFKCGSGSVSASVSALVTTSEIAMVSCRGTTVSIHTERELPEVDWRTTQAEPSNDHERADCDVRRRAA